VSPPINASSELRRLPGQASSHYTPTWTWPRRARQRPDESNRHVALVASRPEGKGTGVRLASGNRAGAPTGATPAAARRPTLPGSGLPLPSRRRTETPVPRRPARRPVAVTNLALYTRPVAGCEPAVGSSPETKLGTRPRQIWRSHEGFARGMPYVYYSER